MTDIWIAGLGLQTVSQVTREVELAIRSSRDVREKVSNARAAASTARSTSSVVASGAEPTSSSVDGEMTSMRAVPAGSTQQPPT